MTTCLGELLQDKIIGLECSALHHVKFCKLIWEHDLSDDTPGTKYTFALADD